MAAQSKKKFAKNEATPLYLQLKNSIKQDIKAGVLKSGEKIPSESEMKEMYHMSRVTIRNALAELEVEGYIQKVQGKGSFVTQSDMLRLPDGVTSLSNDGKMQGVEVTARILEQGIQNKVSEIDKEFFGMQDNDRVMVLKRVRLADGHPISMEENHFSDRLFALEHDDLSGSLYEILQKKYKLVPTIKGRRSVRIGFATEEVAKCLDLAIGTPVIESELGVLDANGEPIHTVKDIVRGDVQRFMKWYV